MKKDLQGKKETGAPRSLSILNTSEDEDVLRKDKSYAEEVQ